MKFVENSRPNRRRLGFDFFFGCFVLSLLLGMSAASEWMSFESFNVDTARQPVKWQWAQNLLYRPLSSSVEQFDNREPLNQFSFNEAFESKIADGPTIISRPNFVASVGHVYHYQVEVSPASSEMSFVLTSDMDELDINSTTGLIRWIPAATQTGEVAVDVECFDENGNGSRQSFRVLVSQNDHLLGTDQHGRDMINVIADGARTALLSGLIAASLSTLIGLLIGGLSGYDTGKLDAILTYLSNVLQSVPFLVIAFLVAVISRFSSSAIMLVVGLVLFPRLADPLKAKIKSFKNRQFVEAAIELGLSKSKILWHEIVWFNCRHLIFSHFAHAFSFALLIEVTLSYLQLGTKLPGISWGSILLEGRSRLSDGDYGAIVLASIMIVITVMGFNLLAYGANKAFATRE